MTNKLPEWVERWIAEVTKYRNGVFSHDEIGCIDVADLRTFLSQFVLCEREPKMYLNQTTGDALPSGVVKGAYIVRLPLHAPAKGAE